MNSLSREDELVQQYEELVSALQYTIGERERLKALWSLAGKVLNAENGDIISKIMRILPTTSAERFQDIFVLLLNGGKRGGFFVEFGACDGVVVSNTLMLEKEFGWEGILAEPDVYWHEHLVKNRTASIDKRCVSSSTGEFLEFNQAKFHCVSSVHKNHQYLGEIEKTYSVPTVSLMDLLKEYEAPAYIDFLSVDCEGHERETLRTFDFDKYKFGFICVEQHEPLTPENDVSKILESAGYEVLFPRDADKTRPPFMQVSGIDLYYVPRGSYHWAN